MPPTDVDFLSPPWPEVAIIVLNWNNYEDTAECLRSLREVEYPNFHVWVVDNNSTDGSGEQLSEEFGWCEFVFNDQNNGFAAGNNIGIKRALSTGPKYILLLNNDTVVSSEFLIKLVQAGESSANTGIVGAAITDVDDEYVLDAGRKFNKYTLALENPHQGKNLEELGGQQNSHAITGCCMLIKKEVIDEIGLLDSSHFFFGGEDVDYCIRARKEGWKIVVQQSSQIRHKMNLRSRSTSPLRKYHSKRNKVYLAKLHTHKVNLFAITLRTIIDTYRVIEYMHQGQWDMAKAIYTGYIDAILSRSENKRFE